MSRECANCGDPTARGPLCATCGGDDGLPVYAPPQRPVATKAPPALVLCAECAHEIARLRAECEALAGARDKAVADVVEWSGKAAAERERNRRLAAALRVAVSLLRTETRLEVKGLEAVLSADGSTP